MTRHGRNATASAVYTYHEKQKDASQSGYGDQKKRLGKDSVKDFDCCNLTLQPCREPILTPDGYLYDKEAILEYIIHQKRSYARRMKEFEKQKLKDEQELKELAIAERQSKIEKFVGDESTIVSTPIDVFDKVIIPGSSKSLSNMVAENAKKLPSFWVPMLTPAAKETQVKKPDKTILCPMSGNPLKMKDFINVKFTLIKDGDDKRSLIAKKNRYMCAVTHDILGNTVPCAVLKTSGNVVTMECVQKLIRKDKDMQDPITSQPLADEDIIPIQMGGTGYSTTNSNLAATLHKPAMQS